MTDFLMQPKNVEQSYIKIASWFDRHRSRDLFEKPYLDLVLKYLKPKATLLDVGCGMGEPIARYFIEHKLNVTGIDSCEPLLELAKARLPQGDFLFQDMRELRLGKRFDAIVAWDSFFHLTPEEQKKMLPLFKKHLNKKGLLLLTIGPKAGEVWSDNGGEMLYHASLSPEEYQSLLREHGFEILLQKIEDPKCNDHSVWFAQRNHLS